MGWGKDSLIKKKKSESHMWKWRIKEEIYSSFYTSRQMSTEFLGSGELVHMAMPSEGKHHNPKYPSLLLSTLPFMTEYYAYSVE